MHAIRPILVVILLLHSCVGVRAQTSSQQRPQQKSQPLTGEQTRQLTEDLQKFSKSPRRGERSYRIQRILKLGPAAARRVLGVVEVRLAKLRPEYCREFQSRLPDAYMARLASLTDEQILAVQKTRLLWRSYVLEGGHRSNFKAEFLAPIHEIASYLLLKPEDVTDRPLQTKRRELVEYGGYLKSCREALGVDPDPTIGKLSPTQIPYPKLDQPPTFLDNLRHTERTLVLAHTIAPVGARRILLFNDEASREIDVQEAEFVMFSNEARLLAGTIAWQVDPLGCAVARDHSNDRKKGLAKGHMSSILEKRGFTHRSRRMGAKRFGSEGVGGGRDGRAYIRSLSYGGGHTGPLLHSLKRNCVGVGRRGGAYTSIYRTDRSLVHPCQAKQNRLFLPPGLTDADVRGPARAIFGQLRAGRFASAHRMIQKSKPNDDRKAMLVRFGRAAVDANADWSLEAAAAIEAAGDVFEAYRRLELARKSFAGVPRFEAAAAGILERLTSERLAPSVRAGREYHRIALGDLEPPARKRALAKLAKRHANTIYATAIEKWEAKQKQGPFAFFLGRRPELEKYEYPPRTTGKR